jgi:hypothetical protein
MLTLSIPGDSVRWPQRCACCGDPFTHTVAAAKTKRLYLGVATVKRTLTIAVPYCEVCSRHAEWASGLRYSGILLRVFLALFLTPIAGAFLGSLLPAGRVQDAAYVALGCGMPFVLAGVVLWYELRKTPRNLDARHASKGLAVEVVDFEKNGMKVKVHHDGYARDVAAANGGAMTA